MIIAKNGNICNESFLKIPRKSPSSYGRKEHFACNTTDENCRQNKKQNGFNPIWD